MSKTLCIYLHGFNSTPDTTKAAALKQHIIDEGYDVDFHVPALPVRVPAILALVEELIATRPHEQLVFLGSSLGGFFATYFAHTRGVRAVLINPGFDQLFDDKDELLGEHVSRHTGETFTVTENDFDELEKLFIEKLDKPENVLLLLQTGDEVLDYRRALARYPDSPNRVHEGGTHRFENIEAYLPEIVQFLGLSRKG